MSAKTDWLNQVEGELHRLEMAINGVPDDVPLAIYESLNKHLDAMKTEVAEYRVVVSVEEEAEVRGKR